MPSGKVDVVIVGCTIALLMTMLRDLVTFPAELAALTEKFCVPAVVGVPDISPVDVFKLKPAGRLPLSKAQVIGAVPVAESV